MVYISKNLEYNQIKFLNIWLIYVKILEMSLLLLIQNVNVNKIMKLSTISSKKYISKKLSGAKG